MATGFPVKANYATGDVLTAANMNDLSGTVNLIAPTAKGDLFAGSAANTYTKLAVGTNGQVLTADSTTATGLKWAAASASTPTFAGCSLYGNNPTISTSTNTALSWTGENYDTDNFHSTSTNTSRITIPSGKAGKYLFTYGAEWEGTNANFQNRVIFYKNGASVKTIQFKYLQDNGVNTPCSIVLDLAVADYVEVYVHQTYGSNRVLYNDNSVGFLQASYLGA